MPGYLRRLPDDSGHALLRPATAWSQALLRAPLPEGVRAMTRLCAFCGKDIAAKQHTAIYCSNRCRKAVQRGADPRKSAAKESKHTPTAWYSFGLVAGPPGGVSGRLLHCASLTDRDPKSGVSAYEETELRNLRRLSVERFPPKTF